MSSKRCEVNAEVRGNSSRSEVWLSKKDAEGFVIGDWVVLIPPHDGKHVVSVFRGFTSAFRVGHGDDKCIVSKGAALCLGFKCGSVDIQRILQPLQEAIEVEIAFKSSVNDVQKALQKCLARNLLGRCVMENSLVCAGLFKDDIVASVSKCSPAGVVKIGTATRVNFSKTSRVPSLLPQLSEGGQRVQDLIAEFHEGLIGEGGLLLHGASGTGKKFVCNTILERSEFPVFRLPALKLLQPELGDGQRYLTSAFDLAFQRRPSSILIEQLDVLRGDKAIVSHLLNAMDTLARFAPTTIAVIATASSLSKVPAELLEVGRFYYHVELVPSTMGEREKLLLGELEVLPNVVNAKSIAHAAAFRTPGFTASDLKRLISYSQLSKLPLVTTENREQAHLEQNDFIRGTKSIQPSAIASSSWWRPLPDIGTMTLFGLDHQRSLLLASMKNYLLRTDSTLPSPRGSLVYGKSGSGKTSLVVDVCRTAAEFANVISVSSAEVVSSVPGEAERSIRDAFRFARDCSPSILVLESVECLSPRRTEENMHSTFRQILTTLLTQLDGISTDDNEAYSSEANSLFYISYNWTIVRNFRDQGKVFVLSTTRDLNWIDPALLRPGRLELHLRTDRIEGETWRALIEEELGGFDVGEDQKRLGMLSKLSGAEVRGLCRELKLQALRNGRSDYTREDIDSFFSANEY